MCSDSCFKYSDSSATTWKICRHGFYHVLYICEGCRARRKGKPLRHVIHAGSEAEAEFGSRGRLRPIQLTPFEVQTSYGGIVAGRQNLDVQDMRRVLDPSLWLTSADCLPQIGGPATELGYMALFEWNGSQYECRPPSSAVPVSWAHWSHQAAAFREDWLRAHQGKELADDRAAAGGSPPASPSEPTEEDDDVDFDLAIRCGVNEAFADGVNSGFYVNRFLAAPARFLVVFVSL